MIKQIRLYLGWLKRVAQWFDSQFRYYLLVILTIPFTFYICSLFFSDWEATFRITGMTLELLGLGTVAKGMYDTHQSYNQPNVATRIKQCFAQFPKLKNNVNITVNPATLNATGSISDASITITDNKEKTLDEMFAELSIQVSDLVVSQKQLEYKVDKNKASSADALHIEKAERELADNKNRELIKNSSIDGLRTEATGIFWLVFGIVFATASAELVCLIFCR